MARRTFVCPICGFSLEQARAADQDQGVSRPLASREAYLTHCQNTHPDFLAWEKSKAKMMIALGVAVSVPVSIVSFWFLLFIVHVPSSAGRGLAFIPLGAFLVPTFLFNKLGIRRYRRDWKLRGGSPALYSTPISYADPILSPSPAEYADEDQGILTVLSDLATKLGQGRSPASSVTWQTMVPQGRGFQFVPSGECLFRNDTVYFAENMKGRLSPEDWRPLIASSLIYRQLREKMVIGAFLRTLPILVAYVASWFIVPSFFATVTYYSPQGQRLSYNNVGWEILIFGGFPLLILALLIANSYVKRIKLIADRRAADLVDKAVLLGSLEKLGRASPSDVQRVETRVRNLSG